jgi:hypothetical protein
MGRGAAREYRDSTSYNWHVAGTCVYKSTIDQYSFTTRVRPRDLHSIAVSKVKAKGKASPVTCHERPEGSDGIALFFLWLRR